MTKGRSEYLKNWRKLNADRIRQNRVDYYEANREVIRKNQSEYYAANKPEIEDRKKKNAAKEPNRIKERVRSRKRYAANPDSYNFRSRKRQQGLAVINELKPGQWEALVAVYGGKCLFPGCNETKVTKDHVIPWSKGGRHHVSNLQPLCSFHNDSKHDKTVDYRAFLVMG